ncbi:hypothetical protein PHMEG_00010757 [Phytophthora megakarya]|uniref:Core-binding (CB) domain-containing protein n=1 Tax=Phytophthora megakarya TaxID=4795 RepID=A0A225WEB0_9STRA|nr:hypothetical protein PHMEG_00010757 [Phytophthora megakarya]
MNEGKLKVSTLSGYRSALNDLYQRKRMDLPKEYLDDLKTFFKSLKRVETDAVARQCFRAPVSTDTMEFNMPLNIDGDAVHHISAHR